MEAVLDTLKSHASAVIAIIFAFVGYYFKVDHLHLSVSVVVMLVIYLFTKHASEARIKNEMQVDIKRLQDENDGLRQNLVNIYSMIQSKNQTNPTPDRSFTPPPRMPPTDAPAPTPTPKAASDVSPRKNVGSMSSLSGDDGRPYL